jgi:hypothetical protein
MKAHRLLWLLLVVGLGTAAAEELAPDMEFLEFLGGLEADDDWEPFFENMPDEAIEPQASTESKDDELE